MTQSIQMAQIKLSEIEINAAVDVMRTGALRQGRYCAEFEKRFAEKVGAQYAITCSSGTAALHLAYLCNLKPGDEVLVPAFTFIATASMVTICGARPVFCDVEPNTWTINLTEIEQKLGQKTKAIAPVHIFGNSCAADDIRKIAKKYGLYLIWDAAQAHGTLYNGSDIGGLDDMVCYSFYPSKNMFTGEGGMVTTNDAGIAEKLKHMRSHGQTGKYYHTLLGLNYRMTDVEAAIGLKQLDRLDDMLTIRRHNAAILADGLDSVEGISIQQVAENCVHAYHQFCILVNPDVTGIDRDELARKLDERGIATGIHYPRGLNRQPIFEKMYGVQPLPVTDRICDQILALPVHHGLTDEQCRHIADSIKSIIS